jgi:hypothetical protein
LIGGNFMAVPEFVDVTACANEAEAQQVRNVLGEYGISARVDGGAVNTALSFVGPANLGGVRILVPAADAERAAEIVRSLGVADETSGAAWYCGKCEETIDGDFQICWSCEEERSAVEAPFPNSGDETQKRVDFDREANAGASLGTTEFDLSNPYASPQTQAAAEDPEKYAPLEINEEAEAMLLRAWRAAIIGIVFIPVLTHFYSMYLLFRAAAMVENFSPQGKKRFYRAFAVDLAACAFYGPMFAYFVF